MEEGSLLIERKENLGEVDQVNENEQTNGTRRVPIAVAGVLVASLLGAAAVVGKAHLSASVKKPTTTLSAYQKEPTEILIYKRTAPTKDPAEDCKYLESTIGLQCQYAEMTMDGSDAAHDDWCGSRAEAMSGNFNIHHIKDMFEPEGDAEKWINRFNAAHAKTFSDDKEWDAFMANSVAYYTPFLQKHLARWIEKDLPYRAHYYTNYADSLRMLVLLTYNPNTGEIVEIHGPAVSKDETENAELIDEHFTEMPAGACELAMGTGLTLAHLSQSWTDDSTTKGYAGDFGGLPFASVVKVSHPTEDADAVTAWMADNADLTFAVEDGAGKDEGTCRVARLKMKKYLDVSYTTVSFVQDTRSDAKSSRDARERAQFLTHVQAVHNDMLGTQSGWDRWLDNHIGLMYQGVHLDDVAPTLVQNGVGFRAYRDVYKMDSTCEASINRAFCGSLWCGGHSALGVEFHSFFDKDRKFFNGNFAPTYMNFCDAKTNTGTTSFFTDDAAIDDW